MGAASSQDAASNSAVSPFVQDLALVLVDSLGWATPVAPVRAESYSQSPLLSVLSLSSQSFPSQQPASAIALPPASAAAQPPLQAPVDATPHHRDDASAADVSLAPAAAPAPAQYRWRKYGIKKVKGNAEQTRHYYRCTNGGCPARKHVLMTGDKVELTTEFVSEHDHAPLDAHNSARSRAMSGGGDTTNRFESVETTAAPSALAPLPGSSSASTLPLPSASALSSPTLTPQGSTPSISSAVPSAGTNGLSWTLDPVASRKLYEEWAQQYGGVRPLSASAAAATALLGPPLLRPSLSDLLSSDDSDDDSERGRRASDEDDTAAAVPVLRSRRKRPIVPTGERKRRG